MSQEQIPNANAASEALKFETHAHAEMVISNITSPKTYDILVTNHKNITAWRHIRPDIIKFGTSQHHPYYQFLLAAWDMDRQVYRHFAMAKIHSMKEHGL